MGTNDISLFNGYTPTIPDKDSLREIFKRIADFQAKCTEQPDPKMVDKTADGKGESLIISYIENKLDEIYSGLWNATNFKYTQILNEICGQITLEVFQPICGIWIKRDGVASIEIMMNAGSDFTQMVNKKRNALYLGLPKLKAECLKNAAKSIGVVFGRDLNRKKTDQKFEPDSYSDETKDLKKRIIELLTTSTITDIEKEQVRKLCENTDASFTRLCGCKERLLLTQKK